MLFTELPREIIEEVLVRCDPIDVAQVAQTCSELFFIIYRSEDQRLWRELYLSQSLDDPRGTVSHLGVERPGPIDWKTDLQRVIRAGIVVSSHNSLILLRPGELHTILDTLLQTVCYTNPRRSQEPFGEVSSNLLWVAAMFRGGFLDNAKEVCGSSVSLEDRMRLARLHTYYGVTHGDALTKNLVQSRAFVYLMRNYRPETGYGPFLENGEVNWVHMQAIHHVVSMHLVSLKEDEDFDFVIYPMCLPYTQTAIPNEQQLENDWAGVTGTWTVSFCFCDHRDLMAFNHASAKALDTSLFEDPDFREVFRSLEAKVNIVRTEHDPANPSHPIIHFYGEMQDPSTSMMTGHVKLTSDNQIQWHFVSGEAGSAIWSSAGVQVGGLRSSFGVLGSWTTVFHEDDDPVGPFWLCKRTITNANGQQGA